MKKRMLSDKERYGVAKIVYRAREIVTYPFEKWLGQLHAILKRGTDFELEPKKMVQQIRNKAIELGLTVSFKIHGDYVSLVVWDRIAEERANAVRSTTKSARSTGHRR